MNESVKNAMRFELYFDEFLKNLFRHIIELKPLMKCFILPFPYLLGFYHTYFILIYYFFIFTYFISLFSTKHNGTKYLRNNI